MSNAFSSFVDICAGIGGFRLGLLGGAIKCVYTSEIDPDCVKTYNKNFSDKVQPSDILSIEETTLPDFDLLCAGFPCQPFSIAGKRLGLEDERAGVLKKLLAIIGTKRPNGFILENVSNFKNFNGGELLQSTIRQLDQYGYHVQYTVLDSADFGVAQKRKRLFIVGIKDGLLVRGFAFPKGDKEHVPFSKIISNQAQPIQISNRWHQYIDLYIGKKQLDELDFAPPKTRTSLERIDPDADLQNCVFQMRSSGVRALSIDKPLPTFAVSVSGGGAMIPVYSKERRHLNLLEMRRIMGFPDLFEFPVSRTSAIKQLANAVVPQVIQAIFESMLSATNRDGQHDH